MTSLAQTKVTRHRVSPVQIGDATCFAAIRMKGDRVRVYFDQATKAEQFPKTAAEGVFDTGVLQIVPLRGAAGLFADIRADRHQALLSLTYQTVVRDIAITDPAHQLSGENCVLTTLNQTQSTDRLHDLNYLHHWMQHHVAGQGATSFAFLNRLGPSEAGQDFAKRLRRLLKTTAIDGLAHVVVVDVPVPTGRIGAGDARDVIYAPEAPGKNRMTAPTPDPWHAPFADEALLDYAQDALFAQSAGVAYLDASDWLTPCQAGTQSVFEQASQMAPDRTIGLMGQRVFAWKYASDAPAPGDHICRPFDMTASFMRWVVAPAKMTSQNIVWRPHRIIGLPSAAVQDTTLYRLSGLRHPQAAPAQLVPRSSLKEDPDCLRFARNTFDHDAVRMPTAVEDTKRIRASDRGNKIVLVTAMKNEGPFLLEWIAYHRAIGVSDIVVFTNDCTDGTDDFLNLLAERGIVEHYDNPFREMGLRPQHAGFRAAESLPTVQNADWLMTLDVDEFINVHVGDGHLRDLFAHVGDANLISCTWRLFGNGARADFTDDFVTRQFTDCASKNAARPHQAWGFKALYQNNGYFKKLGVHRPKGLHGHLVDQLAWVNGSGEAMPEKDFRNGWRSNTQTIGYDLVTLNHYAVRSVESFLVKRDRGRVNHVDRDQGSAYWFRMNHNTTQDRSIQRMLPALQAEFDSLMSDPAIKAAHDLCVARHQQKITELMTQPDQRAFYDSLNASRAQALSKMLPAFGANVFLAGPDAVPQDVIDQAAAGQLPDDFYFTVPRPDETEH